MYHELFDEQLQNKMRSFFLNRLSKRGRIQDYKKGEIVNIPDERYVAIVTEGKFKQVLYSVNGSEKSLFILQPGEIFGEMDFFSSGKGNVINRAMESSKLSIVGAEELDNLLKEDPEGYRFFLHSITRKFRIVMFQMADMVFNSALGKIANMLLRLASQEGKEVGEKILIDISLTHQELAFLVGCSRTTVTKELNVMRDKGILDIRSKKILIKDMEGLQELIDSTF